MSDEKKYTTESFMNEDAELHIVPTVDYLRHWFNANCWCAPQWDEKNRNEYRQGMTKQKIFYHKRIMDKENQH